MKNIKKSFEKWCIENNRQDVLDRWDYKLNDCKPDDITYGTINKYYFKCPKGKHISELKNINSFTNGCNGTMDCKKCNSFEEWCLKNNKQNILGRWDYELNNKKPNEVAYCTPKQYYFKWP